MTGCLDLLTTDRGTSSNHLSDVQKKGFLGSLASSPQSANENVEEKMSKAITLSVLGIYSSNKVQTVRKIVLQISEEKYMGSDSIYREARNIT